MANKVGTFVIVIVNIMLMIVFLVQAKIETPGTLGNFYYILTILMYAVSTAVFLALFVASLFKRTQIEPANVLGHAHIPIFTSMINSIVFIAITGEYESLMLIVYLPVLLLVTLGVLIGIGHLIPKGRS